MHTAVTARLQIKQNMFYHETDDRSCKIQSLHNPMTNNHKLAERLSGRVTEPLKMDIYEIEEDTIPIWQSG